MKSYIKDIVTGMPTTDGAGVKLTRVIGQPKLTMLDPFLLLDAFRSDNPDDYIEGFPPHPHRGFETVTYMLNGNMRHKDNHGNEGVIKAGGIQWMSAGKGIVHSEIPEQENGLLEGFQLWINLPAKNKFDEPSYQEFDAVEIPTETRSGTTIKVITGETSQGTVGPVKQPLTNPLYLDVSLRKDTKFKELLLPMSNSFIYVISGELSIETSSHDYKRVIKDQLALLTQGDEINVSADNNCRFLLIAGTPINEPVARGGPFVMNTKDEILQAFKDYEEGNL